jgi:hypothetical protein
MIVPAQSGIDAQFERCHSGVKGSIVAHVLDQGAGV